MKDRVVVIYFLVPLILFILGLSLVFSSYDLSMKDSEWFLKKNNGVIDGKQYEKFIDTRIIQYTIGGSIISATGGIGFLISYHHLLKNNKYKSDLN